MANLPRVPVKEPTRPSPGHANVSALVIPTCFPTEVRDAAPLLGGTPSSHYARSSDLVSPTRSGLGAEEPMSAGRSPESERT